MKTRSQASRWLLFWLAVAPVAAICWREATHPTGVRRAGDLVGGRQFQTVVIDPGHGGADSGAVGRGLQEKDLTLDVARKLAALLRKEGLHVVFTRNDDSFVSLGDRVRIANAEPKAIFVSIHFNQTENAAADGVETYLAGRKAGGVRRGFFELLHASAVLQQPHYDLDLASSIHEEIVATSAAKDRGVKQQDFFVIRRVAAPAVLVEGGFVSNPRAASRLRSAAYREGLAEAMARGIWKYREGKNGTQTLLAKRTE